MSREDQPVDRTFGNYQDEAGMLPSPSTVQNGEGSAPVLLPGAATHPDAPTELLPTRAVSPGNGNWVAGERSCTHQGAWVNYDPTSGHLVCPAHGAIFDPANAFSVLQGPAMKPLPAVPIHVNANGTVTTP